MPVYLWIEENDNGQWIVVVSNNINEKQTVIPLSDYKVAQKVVEALAAVVKIEGVKVFLAQELDYCPDCTSMGELIIPCPKHS